MMLDYVRDPNGRRWDRPPDFAEILAHPCWNLKPHRPHTWVSVRASTWHLCPGVPVRRP